MFKFKGSMLKAMQACAANDERRHTINAVHVNGCHMQATNTYVWVDVNFHETLTSGHFQLDRVKVDGISAKLKMTAKEMKDFMGQEPGRFPQQDIYKSYYEQNKELFEQQGHAIDPKYLQQVCKVFQVFDIPISLSIRGGRDFVLCSGKRDGVEIHAVIAAMRLQ